MYNNEIYLSPKYKVEDYSNLRLKADSDDEKWTKAIEIFKDRIQGRYLNLIEELIRNSKDKQDVFINYSFSIMALSCLLVETLQQFYLGIDETPSKRNKSYYVDFLKKQKEFKNNFSKECAEDFYSDIRCGILHQAQTKRNTQLTILNNCMVEKIDNGIKVDVEKFYEAIKENLGNYINRINSRNDIELREKFINKMNYIVDKGKS